VISEYPPAEAPYGSNFPKRNRIISGLCQGVLVIEGNKQSGAMITAEKAISQGREVFALPGKINESNSEGPNDLIQSGVNVALSADDLIFNFDFLYHRAIDFIGLRRSKSRSDLSLEAIEKYGVSTEVYFGAFEGNNGNDRITKKNNEDAQITPKKEEPSVIDKTTAQSKEEQRTGADNSMAQLESLDSVTRKVFEAMPLDKAISPDEFVANGISIAEAITSLTMLEIMGLVSSLPGGTYIRK
jgi:predicted Rossmann fold nucleotide-binding protein DprA/Smf involved in DNA uptake